MTIKKLSPDELSARRALRSARLDPNFAAPDSPAPHSPRHPSLHPLYSAELDLPPVVLPHVGTNALAQRGIVRMGSAADHAPHYRPGADDHLDHPSLVNGKRVWWRKDAPPHLLQPTSNLHTPQP